MNKSPLFLINKHEHKKEPNVNNKLYEKFSLTCCCMQKNEGRLQLARKMQQKN